jgi:4-hydroxy-tetrahydrodipicolinate synthase
MNEIPDTFLRGSFPPLVTPFTNGKIDLPAFANLIEYQVDAGSDGIVVCGTTGEPSMLTTHEREQLLDSAIETAANRLAIIAATGSQSYEETLRLTRHAETAGAQATLVVTPYYSRPSQTGLIAYYRALGDATQIPLLTYHIPGRAGVNLTIETLVEIARHVPQFLGMKHASTDLALLSDCRTQLPHQFRLLVGLEELSLPMLALGANATVNAVGNIAPKAVSELTHATLQFDFAKARQLHYQLLELNRAIFYDTNPIPIKYMMQKLGLLNSNEHRLPLVPASPEVQSKCDEVLENLQHGFAESMARPKL